MTHEPKKQVGKVAYAFETYSHLDRWASYYHQLSETLKLNPSSVLEVGVGDKVFGEFLKNNTDIQYKTVDIAEDLHPDVIGSVGAMPIADGSYDVAVAFEVLEHLPFETFEQNVRELLRVSKRHVIISVPHFGPPLKLNYKIPFLPEIKVACKVPYPRVHTFNGQHYWEIGKKGYPPRLIRSKLEGLASVLKDFVPYENQYHHFYVLEKRD
jgi:hypothetical protein